MTRMEIDDLRARCRAAFAVYETHFSKIMENSKHGTPPPASELHAEEDALYEFNQIRRDLLHALSAFNP